MRKESSLAFVIDTEEYAGGFERQMCAYITGQIGECEVGEDMAEIARRELPDDAQAWFEDNVRQEADEHGCSRPVEIVPTPGWFNCGRGCRFRDGTDPAVVRAAHLKAVRDFYEPRIRLHEQQVAAGDATQQHWLDENRADLAKAEREGPGREPAYQSVAILLDQEPPTWIMALMRERALKFAAWWPEQKKWNEAIVITGFRFVKTTLVREDVWTIAV